MTLVPGSDAHLRSIDGFKSAFRVSDRAVDALRDLPGEAGVNICLLHEASGMVYQYGYETPYKAVCAVNAGLLSIPYDQNFCRESAFLNAPTRPGLKVLHAHFIQPNGFMYDERTIPEHLLR